MDREAKKFWQQQRKQMMRRNRRIGDGWLGEASLTKTLIGLMVLAFLLTSFAPSTLNTVSAAPGGVLALYAVMILSPGGFYGLVLDGIFIWLIGSSIEPMARWWQYLTVFFGSAIIAAVVEHFTGNPAISGSLATFGLAGAYIRIMMTRQVGGALRWALILVGLNLVLSGFNVEAVLGLVISLVSGFALTMATGIA